jgi:hypothetical protein
MVWLDGSGGGGASLSSAEWKLFLDPLLYYYQRLSSLALRLQYSLSAKGEENVCLKTCILIIKRMNETLVLVGQKRFVCWDDDDVCCARVCIISKFSFPVASVAPGILKSNPTNVPSIHPVFLFLLRLPNRANYTNN